ADPRAPVVELFPKLEVENALGRDDARQRVAHVREVEQVPSVRADELDEQVELPCRGDDVAGVRLSGGPVGHRLRVPRGAEADRLTGRAKRQRPTCSTRVS